MTTVETLTRVKELYKLIGKFLNEIESEIEGAANTAQSRQLCKIQRIVLRVTGYYGITTSEIYSKCRKAAIVKARHIAIYLLKYEGYENGTILRLFDQAIVDVSSITYSVKLVKDCIDTNADFNLDILQLRKQLRAEGLIK